MVGGSGNGRGRGVGRGRAEGRGRGVIRGRGRAAAGLGDDAPVGRVRASEEGSDSAWETNSARKPVAKRGGAPERMPAPGHATLPGGVVNG